MLNLYVNFPNTNPIVFRNAGDYEPYKDAALREFRTPFCQQFHESDRVSFQIRWEKEYTKAFTAKLYVVVNSKKYLYDTLTTDLTMTPSGRQHKYFWQCYS